MSQASAYAASGVDIDKGALFVKMVKERIAKAWPGREDAIGGFAGLLQLATPTSILKTCCDGSGTIAILGALTGRFSLIGHNAAAMSLVDAYVASTHPVGLNDVIGTGSLDPERHIGIIDGIINACQYSEDCFIVGGETAEQPGMYKYDWIVDINTFVVGIPDPDIVTGNVQPGQPVYGWPSYGPASNGFSLIRNVFNLNTDPESARDTLNQLPLDGACSLADALLVPAPVYINQIEVQRRTGIRFAAHAHITGGGLVDNIPRVLPENCKVVLDRSAWLRPSIFKAIQETGHITPAEMDRVFNQGIMVASIIDGNEMPDSCNATCIGTVEQRQGNEPQVQFTGSFKQ
ncbi:MAG: AIR synthase-related protein [Candidatus Andersenbacteria bacterium]|nr:AIR synthase-related protein [bacterium]MDZ4225228.1 AIR synthase-related protein [Candidatus Andersenbacteria bacterium]